MMKLFRKVLLFVCAVPPLISFFPFEAHYLLFRALYSVVPTDPSPESASFQTPGFSYKLLDFFGNELPFVAAGLFLFGLFVFRSTVRKGQKIRSFYLIWCGYFFVALTYFAHLHLLPFLFAVITLALLANIREMWASDQD